MKSEVEKPVTKTQYRRYSDHPVVQQKLAKAKEVLTKADLDFLKIPSGKK